MSARKIITMMFMSISLHGAQQAVPAFNVVVHNNNTNTNGNTNRLDIDNKPQDVAVAQALVSLAQGFQALQAALQQKLPSVSPIAHRPSAQQSPMQGLADLPSMPAMLEKKSAFIMNRNSMSTTKLGIGASCAAGVGAWLKMKFLTRKVLRTGHWATWHSDIPCQVLMELSDEEIIGQLWPAVRDHYTDEDQDPDVFAIIGCFLDDIEQERACLRELLWWYYVMRLCKLSTFLGDDTLESKAVSRCQRLDFLEDCVHMWANACLCKDGIVKEEYEKKHN